MKRGEKMKYEEINETVESLYKKYSIEIFSRLFSKGILFEFDYGFGGPVIEYGVDHLQYLLKKDGTPLPLASGCYLNNGDTLYYIYNKKVFDMYQAQECAKQQYDKNSII